MRLLSSALPPSSAPPRSPPWDGAGPGLSSGHHSIVLHGAQPVTGSESGPSDSESGPSGSR
eukprot:123258-Hanusia_phi.AAC.9